MKIWDKGFDSDPRVDAFTVGKDRELDLLLAPFDIEGSIAHVKMLCSQGLLKEEELNELLPKLEALHKEACEGRLTISGEDIHSEVEERLGELGKIIHTGRSRNDQVALDIKLFTRSRIQATAQKVKSLFSLLIKRAHELKDIPMPGYTHMQVAMPSSFGLWLSAYAECLCDDLLELLAAYNICNRNPLGSAAGYGSSAPISREETTELLGFASMAVNSIYAQMGRGRTERVVAFAYSCIADTLSHFAGDCCMYSSQNFGFISLPKEFTTGSSIMPQKKNPDVFELVRAKCNLLQGVPEQIRLVTGNLPLGYSRDMQVLKEVFLPMFDSLDECLDILLVAIPGIEVTRNIMESPLYAQSYCVEEVNRLVEEGMPFREAYRKVAAEVLDGNFHFEGTPVRTHEGSAGNLCLDIIQERFHQIFCYLCGYGREE